MIKSITTVKLEGRRVILRAGFDVPLVPKSHSHELTVLDDTRIKEIIPTIKHLIAQNAKIVILAKLGRPGGKWDEALSLWPVAERLAQLLDYEAMKINDRIPGNEKNKIFFLTSDITKDNYSALSENLSNGNILFLENTLFYPGEESNDPGFIKTLGEYGEIYVNDAFSSAHRKTASTHGIAMMLKSYAGLSLLSEINSLNKVINNPHKPFVLVMGGAKTADKIATMHHLADKVDHILLGGAIANSFLKARGYEIGKSVASDISLAKDILRNYKNKIIMPIDVVVAQNYQSHPRAVNVEKVKTTDIIFDIGPATILEYAKIIRASRTLVWNGPMGLIEEHKFSTGSKSIAQVFAARSKGPSYGLIGGGETIEVVNRYKVAEFIDHVSTGGGAMLEFLAGKQLPGIKVLETNHD